MRQALKKNKTTQMKPQRNITLKEGAFPGAGAPWAAGHVLAPSPTGGTHAWHPAGPGCPAPQQGGTRSNAPPCPSDFVAQSHLVLPCPHPSSPPRHASGKKVLTVTRHTLPRPLNSEEIIKTAKRVCVASAGEMAPGPQRVLPHVRRGSPGGQPAPGVGASCLPPPLPFPLSTAQRSAAARHALKFPLKVMNQSCPAAAGPAARPWRRTAQLSAAGPGSCTALAHLQPAERRLKFLLVKGKGNYISSPVLPVNPAAR